MSRQTDRATSISISIRSGPRTRSTRSASTSIGRCRIGATARTISITSQAAPSTISTISAAMSGAARPSTSTIPPPARPATRRARSASRRPARPITDGAYGKPWVYKPKAIKEWWQNQHYQPAGRRRVRHAHRLGAAVEADLVHRARLPGGRQGLEPAERLHRSQELGELRAVLLAGDARRSDAAPLYPGAVELLRSRTTRPMSPARTRPPASMARRMVDVVAALCLHLGRAALPRLSAMRSRCGPMAAIGSSAIG